jgi:hypothetical protein
VVCQTNPSRAADFAIATGSGNLKATLLGLHCLMDCRPVTLLETLIKEGAAVITFAGLSRLSFFSRAKAPTSTHTRAIRPSISTRNIPGYDRRFAVKAAGRWRSGAVCSYRRAPLVHPQAQILRCERIARAPPARTAENLSQRGLPDDVKLDRFSIVRHRRP